MLIRSGSQQAKGIVQKHIERDYHSTHLWRAGEVEKRIQRAFHPPNFALDDAEILGRQQPAIGLPGLNEQFNRRQRVADFVRHTRRELAEGGQLFRTQHFLFSLLQFSDHLLDLLGETIRFDVQIVESPFFGDDELGRARCDLSGRIAELHAEFPVRCYKVKFDEAGATNIGWPESWPEVAQSALLPQMHKARSTRSLR